MAARKKIKTPPHKIPLKIKVSPRLHWVFPHIRKAKHKMPALEMPLQIRSFKPNRKKIMRHLGTVYFASRTIVLATHDQLLHKGKGRKARVYRIVKLSHHKILETLAHELAHLSYPDHTFEQEEYTKIIFRAFEVRQKCPTCRGRGAVIAECKNP